MNPETVEYSDLRDRRLLGLFVRSEPILQANHYIAGIAVEATKVCRVILYVKQVLKKLHFPKKIGHDKHAHQ